MTFSYPPYEVVLIVDSEFAAVNWNGCEASVRDVFQKYEGEILELSKWEDRKLAYPLKKQGRGTYVVLYVRLNPANVAKLRRACELHDKFLRVLILKADTAKRVSEGFRTVVLKKESNPSPAPQTKTSADESESTKENFKLTTVSVP